jgi:mannose/fructose/N-acetylgalactosamine-specific phosphotransferase system component IID
MDLIIFFAIILGLIVVGSLIPRGVLLTSYGRTGAGSKSPSMMDPLESL